MFERYFEKRLLPAMFIVLILTALYHGSVDSQSPDLIVRVLDPLGTPLEKIEVVLVKDSETYRFVTNTTGYAVFSGLDAGEYTVRAKLNQVIVAESRVNFPTTLNLVIVANISDLKISLKDMDKRPVPSAEVRLVSSTGLVEYSGTTDSGGDITFSKIPYSSLNDIKGYNIKIVVEGYTIFTSSDLAVDKPKQTLEYILPLINLNITTLNMEGELVGKTTIRLKAGNFSRIVKAEKGTAVINQIPSSDIEWIREYTLNVTYTVGGVEYNVYYTKRSLSASQSLDLVLQLARLEVVVLDEEDRPVKDALVSLSNNRSKNFMRSNTDERGKAIFLNIPTSTGLSQAGEYIIQLYRLDKKMEEKTIEVSSAKTTVELKIARSIVEILLRDYTGEPVAGHTITLIDLDSGEKYSGVTDDNGKIDLKMFPGRYDVQVAKDGIVKYKDIINIQDKNLILDIKSMNFPLRLQVLDAIGNIVKNIEVKISLGGEEIYDGPMKLLSNFTLPYAGYLTIDIKSSGSLILRETILVNGPALKTVRLDSYIEFLGVLIPLEIIALAVSIVVSSIIIFIGIIIIYRESKKRRLITK
ncbi:MAG: carboxypeptidase-like regulatory domain-containing protein [Candidatus Caldarchaeales archaeon]